jgi:hypothetical protein
MNKIAEIFETKLFLTFLLLLFVVVFGKPGEQAIGTIGINRTVNWAWDLTLPNLFITISVTIIFILAYLILFLFKKRTNKVLSITQFGLFAIVSLLYELLSAELIFTLNFISIIVFFANLIWSLRNKSQTRS